MITYTNVAMRKLLLSTPLLSCSALSLLMNESLVHFLGYEGAPTFPVDFAKYVHDLLNKSHTKESSTPIVLS